MNIEKILKEAQEKLAADKQITIIPGTSLTYDVGYLIENIENSGYISKYSKIELKSGNEVEIYLVLDKIEDAISDVKDVEERLDEADEAEEEDVLNLCFELERVKGTV